MVILLYPVTRAYPIAGIGDLVFDPAVQWETAITAVNTASMVFNQVLDLTPVDEVLLASGDFQEDLDELTHLADEAMGLSWEAAQLSRDYARLFGAENLPDTSYLYALRRAEVTIYLLDGYHYAMKTQTLLKRTVHVVNRMLAFVDHISAYLGNLQGLQRANEASQQLAHLAAQANLQRAAFERAQSMRDANDISSEESLRRINRNFWKTWPGMAE